MYAEEPCWYCGENDGFVKYHNSPTAKECVPLCNDCMKRYSERDGYSGYFKVERCPTCHKHTRTIWRLYKKGDQADGQAVKQCKHCEDWFAFLFRGYCDECERKPKVQEFIKYEERKERCPNCDLAVAAKRRESMTGKVFRVFECWKCGWELEEMVGERKVERPEGVKVFD